MTMTELRPAYLVMDAPIPYDKEEMQFLKKAILSAESVYDYFDPVILDVSLEDIICLMSEIDRVVDSGSFALVLSRGRRADLCSILSCLLSDYVSLYPQHIDVDKQILRTLEQKAYGHK